MAEEMVEAKLLPQAIAIEIETEDYGLIRRQFLVAGDLPDNKSTL